jgi:DNA-binding transcriptional ArsR family regulator
MRQLSADQITLVAMRSRALGDGTRVRILNVLARGEQPVRSIATALASEPSTISKHLQVLFHAGLVVRRREASTVVYAIADASVADWCRYLAAARLSSRNDDV